MSNVTDMIGLVLVTHGRLAEEFVTAMVHVVGPQERIATISIGPDDDMEERRADIAAAIAAVDTGRGVIVLTDLFGGTPSNLAISLMTRGHVEVIAGMNLPMLIRLGSARKSMKVVEAVAAARAHIAAGLTVREAAARLKIGKTALYKALEGAGAQRVGETARTGA